MSTGALAFLAVATPLMLAWIALSIRYARANHRWLSKLAEVDDGASHAHTSDSAWILRLVPKRPKSLYYAAHALVSAMSHSLLFMFREDIRNSELEELRRESVARFMPLAAIVAGGAVIFFAAFIAILVFLGLRALFWG